MAKFNRGDVYYCMYPNGKDKEGKTKLKPRPMIVLSDTDKKLKLVPLIYCTGENKELETNYQIVVEKGSDEYVEMGLEKTTYIITPKCSPNFPVEFIMYKIGHCSLMDKVDAMRMDYLSYGEPNKKAS
jgi:hypothetical protein